MKDQFSKDKILKHLDRVMDWHTGGNPAPVTVEMDMSNQCNHNCPGCINNKYIKNDDSDLGVELARKTIDEMSKSGVKALTFAGGGEPLCNKHTVEMVKFANDSGMNVGFITNGELLTEEISRELAENCQWIRVSLDAASSTTYSKMHGVTEDRFDVVLNNIKTLVKQTGSATIGVGFLTCRYNRSEIYDVASITKSLKVDYVQYRPMLYRRHVHLTDVLPEILKAKHDFESTDFKVLYLKPKYDSIHNSNSVNRNYSLCYGQQFITVIAASGKMYVCCHMRGVDKYEIGDLNDDSFIDIWNSDKRRQSVDGIDFKDCVDLCRCDVTNRMLWDIKQEIKHPNFL